MAAAAAPVTAMIMPGDPGWDDARRAWNLAVDQRPAAVASFWTAEAYDRLRWIKAAVDPGDMIRSNHPIPPYHQGTPS